MAAGEVWGRVAYFFTGTEWTAGFSGGKYGILPLFIGTATVAIIGATPNPGDLIYLQEHYAHTSVAWLRPALKDETHAWGWAWANSLAGGTSGYVNNHNGGGIVVFIDGHARFRLWKTLRSGEFGLLPPDVLPQQDGSQSRSYPIAF